MVHLLPSTLTYTILGQKLTPACYRDTFLVLSCSSDVPSVSQAYLLENIELENGEEPSYTSSFVICPYYEKSSFASFESGVGRVLGDTGPQQYALEE
jgi:hypothetical protein